MSKHPLVSLRGLFLALLVGAANTTAATELGIRGTQFTLNGEPAFLLGISYYGALGAPREFIQRDLDDLRGRRFNWIRVWATWGAFGNNVAAVDAQGKPREPFLAHLKWLLAECDRRGIVVDITLSRGNGAVGSPRLQTLPAHRRAVEGLVTALKARRNWYLDLANERNIKDKRHVPFAELRQLRDAAKRLDPARLITASHAGDISQADLRAYLLNVRVDFLSPHRPRNPRSPRQTEAKTRDTLARMKAIGRVVPVHYQEPFRRTFTRRWEPKAADFLADLRGALAGGAAGWCLHNGDNKRRPDRRPGRSFDMRERRLFDQLDPEELKVVKTAASMAAGAADDAGPIRPYTKNPRYWQFKGKPVLLLGGTDDDNLFQWTGARLTKQLDLLRSVGGNYVRCTMSCRDEGNVWPFARKGNHYDLDQWNGEFWRRFERFLAETARRDIIVQIELWATFDYYRDLWNRNPFNPKNNVNYSPAESGLPTRVRTHPVKTDNPFFFSVPKAKNLKVVLGYQRRFVEKLLSISLKHGHVLYCMDNETSVTPEWGFTWARLIRQKAQAAGTHAETTEMWDKWDLAHPQHNPTFDRYDLYTFCDISQNNHQKRQAHYDNALKQRRRIARHIRPLNNVKIYGADTGRFGSTRDGIERFWRNVFGGLASARFHRPPSGQGLNPRAQRNIQSARTVTDAFDLFAAEPRNGLLGEREPNEAFCLADRGRQYALYFPAAGQVTLDTRHARRKLTVRWYDIDRGKWLKPASAQGGVILPLKSPGKGQWAVVVR